MSTAKASSSASKTVRQRSIRLILLSVGIVILVCLASNLIAWKLLDLRIFDYYSTAADPFPSDQSPVIVAIDEPSFAEIPNQWPWPRSLHAQLIDKLRAAGAKAIGLDIIFAEPSNEEADTALANAVGPDVVLAGDISSISTPQANQTIRTEPLPSLLEKGAKVGIASLSLDPDGTFRRLPGYGDSFALKLAKLGGFQGGPPENTLLQALGPARSFPTASYYQALDPDQFLPKDFFRNRIVLIGLSLQNTPTIQSGGSDAFITPYTVHTNRLLPGVELQATIVENLMKHLSMTSASAWLVYVSIILAALVAILLVRQSTSWKTFAWSVAATVVIVGASLAALQYGRIFVPPSGALIAFAGIAFAQAGLDYAAERRQRREIVRAFSHYISPALVDRLAKDPSMLKLGGERRTLSILFCDVRGFTTIAETMKDNPEQLTRLINRLLTPLSDVVLKHGGTIDKYIGDCLMAFWNAPLDDPHHATNAVTAAVEMLQALDHLNVELETEALANGTPSHRLRIGIGINTGDCVVGNMGSTTRFDYSCLGDAVNLASRLEGASKNYGVPLLIGESTAELASETFEVVELDRIKVKGRRELSPVYTVLPTLSPAARHDHERFLAAKYSDAPETAAEVFQSMSEPSGVLLPYYQTVVA